MFIGHSGNSGEKKTTTGFWRKLENEKKNVKFTKRNLSFTKQKIRVLKFNHGVWQSRRLVKSLRGGKATSAWGMRMQWKHPTLS